MGKIKRTTLPLKDKVALIKKFETGSTTSHRQLAALYNCGRTQVAEILKRKTEIMAAFETNMNSQSKRLKSGAAPEMQMVDNMTWDWFSSKRGDGMSITGPLLQEKALFFAASIGLTDFKASNGWLQRFKVSDHNCNPLSLLL